MLRRFSPVFRAFGLIAVGFGLLMLLPIALSLYLDDGAVGAFDAAALVAIASGLLMWLATRRDRRDLRVRDGFLLVVMVWTVLPLYACLPLMYQLNMSFTDAYFEAASGLTATGATVIVGLDLLPTSINFWRCFLVWIGGLGLIVLAVAVLPLLGIGGRQIFKAETPGPMKESQLTPRIAETAKGLWVVYGIITLACLLAYRWAGMEWLDAVMHAFTTTGLGGFSSHDASFAYFDSPTIEAVAIVFMVVAGINFATHFLALHGRNLRVYAFDPEAGWYLLVLGSGALGIAVYLYYAGTYEAFSAALRHAAFNVVSIATTTGYANTDYGLWPMFAPLWMLFLGSFSSSAGSTGGGIKMIRALVLYKQLYRELVRAMHPAAVYPVRVGGVAVSQNILFAVLAFSFVYMASIVSMTLLLTFSGLEVLTAFSAVAASINNIGPGLAQVGPATTYAGLTDFQTWVCTFAMLLGRLEIFTLLVVLTPAFWRK
jgi:trk system potassium uptake protein TrkH